MYGQKKCLLQINVIGKKKDLNKLMLKSLM